MGKWNEFFGMLWVSGILCACSSSASHYAPDRNFYFEIVKHRNDNYSAQLSDDLKRHISKHKYTITNQSGTRWPFYKELNPDEDLPKDSLMPPHWFLHRMVVMKPDQRLEIDDYFVRIDLVPLPDTIPNYSLEIFRMDSTGLVIFGRTGIHYIDSSEFSSLETLSDIYLKSIIRYSFK